MRNSLLSLIVILALPFIALPAVQAQTVNAFAGDSFQQLASITNDRNPSIDRLFVAVDPYGMIQGIRFMPGGSNVPADFTDAQMSSKNGANLEQDTHRPIILYAEFDTQTPDRMDWVVDYLSNGLLGNYKSCRAAVVRDTQGQWHLFNVYKNVQVNQLQIKTWMLGISTIQGICP